MWSEKRVVELERLIFDNKIALPDRELAPQPKAPQLAPGIIARESGNTGGEGIVAEARGLRSREQPVRDTSAAPAIPTAPSKLRRPQS